MTTNLKNLSNIELVEETKNAVVVERAATLDVIHKLQEINRRSLHLSMGFNSLHEFCVVELKYSDGAAFRRLHAMKLCEEFPQAKQAILNGDLSLSNAASLHAFFKKEGAGCSTEVKQQLLREVHGKSKAECEKILYPEKKGTEFSAFLDDETMDNLKRLSEILAIPMSDTSGLVKQITEIALKVADPMKKGRPKSKQKRSEEKKNAPSDVMPVEIQVPAEAPSNHDNNDPISNDKVLAKKASRYILRTDEQYVWQRDEGRCCFVDPITQRRCTSRYGLELDHMCAKKRERSLWDERPIILN